MNSFDLKTMLQKPYPSHGSLKSRVTFVILSGIIVFAIMYIFKPFGLSEFKHDQIVLYAFGYGLVTWIATTIFLIILPLVCPSCFEDSRWNIVKELVFTLMLIVSISLGNVIFLHLSQGNMLSIGNLILMCLYTISVGIFPIGVGLFVKQTILTNRYRKLSHEIKTKATKKEEFDPNISLVPDKKNQESSKMVTLTGDNQTDILTIQAESLIYLQTADNYVKICYLVDEVQKKNVLFRSTLSKIESQLEDKDFLRCHRSYLVNVKFIEDIIGDAQGLKLIIRHIEDVVPVGRSYTAYFKNHFKYLQ